MLVRTALPYPSIPLQKESPAGAGLFFCGDKPRLLIAALFVATVNNDLAANFAPGEFGGVDIHVTGSLANCTQCAGKITSGDPLPCWSNNIGCCDRAVVDCSRTARRAGRLSATAAQKDHHATGDVNFAEVDMRHERAAGEVVKGFCKGDGPVFENDSPECAGAIAIGRRHFVCASEAGGEDDVVVGSD